MLASFPIQRFYSATDVHTDLVSGIGNGLRIAAFVLPAATTVLGSVPFIQQWRRTMKRIMMMSCISCHRIKHFDKWVLLQNIVPPGVGRNLAHLIMADAIDWVRTTCPDCCVTAKSANS